MTRSSDPIDVQARAAPLRLTFAVGRRGGVVGTEQPLPPLLLELAGADERAQHARLVQSRRETADELRQLEQSLPGVRAADEAAQRQALKRGSGKMPQPKAPAVEASIAALRSRLDSFDAVLVEAAQELLASIPEPALAAAWEDARQAELEALRVLPDRVREVLAALDRAARLRAQRDWTRTLLVNRSASPYGPGSAARSGEESRVHGDLRIAVERLEVIAAGVEEAALATGGDAEWRMDPRWMTKAPPSEATS
jgi:hypothetical protein